MIDNYRQKLNRLFHNRISVGDWRVQTKTLYREVDDVLQPVEHVRLVSSAGQEIATFENEADAQLVAELVNALPNLMQERYQFDRATANFLKHVSAEFTPSMDKIRKFMENWLDLPEEACPLHYKEFLDGLLKLGWIESFFLDVLIHDVLNLAINKSVQARSSDQSLEDEVFRLRTTLELVIARLDQDSFLPILLDLILDGSVDPLKPGDENATAKINAALIAAHHREHDCYQCGGGGMTGMPLHPCFECGGTGKKREYEW